MPLATSAAGVGVLALAQPAEARIVYTKIHYRIPIDTSYLLDLNHDGVTDFRLLRQFIPTSSGSAYASLWAQPLYPTLNKVEGSRGQPFVLKRGARIGSPWSYSSNHLMALEDRKGAKEGHWVNVTDRYLGLKFSINGKVHYGWVRLTVTAQRNALHIVNATVTGYAYETIPNKPIIAGKTHGKDEATLGRLAQGASGVSNGGKP